MILTIDVGTTTFKGALVSQEGQVIALRKYPLKIEGGIEVDPLEWEKALASFMATLPHKSEIEAIVVSGNGPTLVPTLNEPRFEEGIITTRSAKARLWLDKRAHLEAQEISSLVGSYIDASFFLPKALYLKREEPKLYQQSQYFLPTGDYINYLLTNAVAATLHADDGAKWYWTKETIAQVGLAEEKFPPLIRSGELVGVVSSLAAKSFGLKEGLPLSAGGPDFIATILGSGITRPSMVCNRSGTSEGVNLCTSSFIHDKRLLTYKHPVEPYYNLSGVISTSGKAINWAKELLLGKERELEEFYKIAASTQVGEVIFLPYLSGERTPIWNPAAQGVLFGLTLESDKGKVARAVVEGVCFALRDVLEVMDELGGEAEVVRVTGGPAESAFLNQMKADVTGLKVEVPTAREAELVGLAIIGYTALGRYSSLREGAQEMVKVGESYLPDERLKVKYDHLFETYRSLYNALKGQWGHSDGSRN